MCIRVTVLLWSVVS